MPQHEHIIIGLLAIVVLLIILWIFEKARNNNGVAEIPYFLMFGWGGAAWGKMCIVVDKDSVSKGAIVAHEKCHQDQMRRDGTFTFYYRYFSSDKYRFEYELEAYREWLRVSPQDTARVVKSLLNSYNLDIPESTIWELITNENRSK